MGVDLDARPSALDQNEGETAVTPRDHEDVVGAVGVADEELAAGQRPPSPQRHGLGRQFPAVLEQGQGAHALPARQGGKETAALGRAPGRR